MDEEGHQYPVDDDDPGRGNRRQRRRDRLIPHWLAAVYHPQPLPRWVGPALTVVLIATSATRAWDYLSIPTPEGEVLAYIQIIGVRTWGWAFLVVAVGLAVALASRGLAPLVVAHCAGIAVYSGYMMALTQGVLGLETGDPSSWRFATIAGAGLAVHIIRVATLGQEVAAVARRPPPDRRRVPRE